MRTTMCGVAVRWRKQSSTSATISVSGSAATSSVHNCAPPPAPHPPLRSPSGTRRWRSGRRCRRWRRRSAPAPARRGGRFRPLLRVGRHRSRRDSRAPPLPRCAGRSRHRWPRAAAWPAALRNLGRTGIWPERSSVHQFVVGAIFCSMISPLAARSLARSTSSAWASSTSRSRTGPAAAMSSCNISAARLDILPMKNWRTASLAPLSAMPSFSLSM